MRGGLFRSWSGLAVVTLLGACSNIIGISSYEIDPALDDSSGGASDSGGKSTTGGKNTAGSHNDGGEPTVGGDGTGGSTGGKNTAGTGGKSTAGTGTGGSPGGEPGVGGEPPQLECMTAGDCDDTIDCTVDTCSGAGACVHTPKNTLCDSSQCETCKVGIGCEAGTKTMMQLLLDPAFDLVSADWDESGSDGINVVTNAQAQTPTKIAKFGPVTGASPKAQQYSDLFQYITVPVGTVGLTLTGYYKLTSGTKAPKDDYLVAAFYPIDCSDPNAPPDCDVTMPFTQFHSFDGTVGPSTTWKAFTYSAPKADVAKMGGIDYTFDLVAHVWDTVFQVDSLQMNATICQ